MADARKRTFKVLAILKRKETLVAVDPNVDEWDFLISSGAVNRAAGESLWQATLTVDLTLSPRPRKAKT